MRNFHVSLPCESIQNTVGFYTEKLGLTLGRQASNWVDINMFGNQVTFVKRPKGIVATNYYSLDSKRLPLFHLGIILDQEEWNEQLNRHRGKSYLEIEPTVFMNNKIGEHDSFFIKDPNGYYLEFKTFRDSPEIFKQNANAYSD